ncbi:SAM-dependent methyltransferase [[Actinomadura] parvosata]|uniref:SAM-dependent methyltransferase n=1 Tax=[Actinomadura] parvosata TaxID=1955412 RepID=UPI00406C2BB3
MTHDPRGPGSTFNPAQAAPWRTYGALLGAKDTFAADRKAAEEMCRTLHGVPVKEVTRENAAALIRAVHLLAGQGHTQFADLGGGRPMNSLNDDNLPDLATVAEAEQPARQWLLLDSDVSAVTAGRALLGGAGVAVVQQDLRHLPGVIAALHDHLDMSRPVVVILGAVLHFLTMPEAQLLLDALWEELASGSVVVVTHLTGEGADPDTVQAGAQAYRTLHDIDIYPRTRQEITGLAARFDLRPPGVVQTIEYEPPDAGPAPVPGPHFLMWVAERS